MVALKRLWGAAPLTLLYLLACTICRLAGLSRRWQAFRLRVGPLTVTAKRYPTVTSLAEAPTRRRP